MSFELIDMDYTSEIQAFVDSDLFITANWIEVTLKVNHRTASKLISDYKIKHGDKVNASYTICGTINGSYSMVIVPESSKTDVCSEFSDIADIQVFSIQNNNSSSLYSQLEHVQTSLVKEQLLTPGSSQQNGYLTGKTAPIQFAGLVVKPPGERIASSTPKPDNGPKDTAAERMTKLFASRAAESSNSSANSNPSKAAKASSVNNFFAKTGPAPLASSSSTKSDQAAKNSTAPPATLLEITKTEESHTLSVDAHNSLSKIASTEVETTTNMKASINDEEEEWDDGSGYKIDPERLKKRKKKSIPVFHDDDDEESVPVASTVPADSIEPVQEEVVSKKRGPAKQQLAVAHGAMDNFMKDNKSDQSQGARDNADGSSGKRKKRKLIEKVFFNVLLNINFHIFFHLVA